MAGREAEEEEKFNRPHRPTPILVEILVPVAFLLLFGMLLVVVIKCRKNRRGTSSMLPKNSSKTQATKSRGHAVNVSETDTAINDGRRDAQLAAEPTYAIPLDAITSYLQETSNPNSTHSSVFLHVERFRSSG